MRPDSRGGLWGQIPPPSPLTPRFIRKPNGIAPSVTRPVTRSGVFSARQRSKRNGWSWLERKPRGRKKKPRGPFGCRAIQWKKSNKIARGCQGKTPCAREARKPRRLRGMGRPWKSETRADEGEHVLTDGCRLATDSRGLGAELFREGGIPGPVEVDRDVQERPFDGRREEERRRPRVRGRVGVPFLGQDRNLVQQACRFAGSSHRYFRGEPVRCRHP